MIDECCLNFFVNDNIVFQIIEISLIELLNLYFSTEITHLKNPIVFIIYLHGVLKYHLFC